MKTLDQEKLTKVDIGRTVYCIDEQAVNECNSPIKLGKYTITHIYSDNHKTFGFSGSNIITKFKYFSFYPLQQQLFPIY